MRIADNLAQLKSPYVRASGPGNEVRTQNIKPTGDRYSADPMMSDGSAVSSRLTNSGLALDSAQSSYNRFKSIIDRYV